MRVECPNGPDTTWPRLPGRWLIDEIDGGWLAAALISVDGGYTMINR